MEDEGQLTLFGEDILKESLNLLVVNDKCRSKPSPVKPDEKPLSARPNPQQREEIAARHGLNERTLRRYALEGVDLWDDAAIEARKATVPSGSEEMKELKAEKLRADTRHKQAQAERAELLLSQTRGELVSVPAMAELAFAVASQVGAMLARLEGELPGALEGKSAADMQPVIRERVDAVRSYLADNLSTPSAAAVEIGPALHDASDRDNPCRL
jgi:hypothetical protein